MKYMCIRRGMALFIQKNKPQKNKIMRTEMLAEIVRMREVGVYLCNCPKLSKVSYPQIAVIH